MQNGMCVCVCVRALRVALKCVQVSTHVAYEQCALKITNRSRSIRWL